MLLSPGDLWIDLWIPANDPRYDRDISTQAHFAGAKWAAVLGEFTGEMFDVQRGPMVGNENFSVACFAGRASGEVVHRQRKVVGVTQWRVREGAFVSTLLCFGPTLELLKLLSNPPRGLDQALDHDSLESLHLAERRQAVRDQLLAISGPWEVTRWALPERV